MLFEDHLWELSLEHVRPLSFKWLTGTVLPSRRSKVKSETAGKGWLQQVLDLFLFNIVVMLALIRKENNYYLDGNFFKHDFRIVLFNPLNTR